FVLRDNCGAKSLVPHQGCNVYVSFRPTHTGAHTATLRFPNDGVNPDEYAALSGTATAPPPPKVAVTPSAVDFGRVRRGTSATQALLVRTAGLVSLALGSLGVTPAAGGFSAKQSGCLGAALAPGKTCRV